METMPIKSFNLFLSAQRVLLLLLYHSNAGGFMRLFRVFLLTALMSAMATCAWAGSHAGVITLTIKPNVLPDSKVVNLWAPYPVSNAAQKITDMNVQTNADDSAVYRDSNSGALFLYNGWTEITDAPEMVMSFHVELGSREVGELKDSDAPVPAPIAEKYLASTPQVPADRFKEQAAEITDGKTTILEKAKAVYDWTVENTFRDPEVKGCGLAQPGRTLTECKGGGKCADLSAVFVTLARAAGVPSRDVYGLRLGDPKNGDVTSGFHCWAEFYLPGTGWVPVDPADVRKMMLVHDLKLEDKATNDWRDFFWGGDDLFRITLGKDSHGVVFTPKQQGEPLNYFMYPFAQVDGETLNYFDPKAFSYNVTYTADQLLLQYQGARPQRLPSLPRSALRRPGLLGAYMLTRRTFFRNGLVVAAAAGTVGLGRAAQANVFPETPTNVQYMMIIDPGRCMGCNSCITACKLQNETAEHKFLTTVACDEVGDYPTVRNQFAPQNCNQCEQPPCLPACPQKAISKLPNGVVVTDWGLCTGDGACVTACPYDARFIDPHFGKVDKCDFCLHRLAQGLQPACVESCPSSARLFGDVNAPEGEFAEYLKRSDLVDRLPELGLATHVRYAAGSASQGNSMQKKKSPNTSRRAFLATAGVGLSTAALGAAIPGRAQAATPDNGPGQAPLRVDQNTAVVSSVCLACNARCGVRGVVKDGRLVDISGNPYHPYNMHFEPLSYDTPIDKALEAPSPICTKALDTINHTYSPYRLTRPLKRNGPRGSGKFEPIEWETLVAELTEGGKLFAHLGEERHVEGLKALDSDDPIDPDDPSLGPKRNGLVCITGRLQSGRKEFIDRFVKKAMGSQNRIGHTDICGLGFRMGNWALTEQQQAELKTDPKGAEYILVFGANIYEALQPGINTYGAIVSKRRSQGQLQFSVVDPRATKASAHAQEWIPVKPGHDGALAMGIARWMVDNDRCNTAFLTAPNLDMAKARGFGAYSNAPHLVITQKGHRREGAFLRLKDIDPSRGGEAGEDLMVLEPGAKTPTPASLAKDAQLEGSAQVTDYFGNTFTVTTAFSLFKAKLMEMSLEEYADAAGAPAKQIAQVAKEFSSHGTRAGVTQYHGAGNYADGSYAAYAVAVLPLLIGSLDMRGGYMKSGGGAGSPKKGLYDIAHFEGERKPKGARISREKGHYEKTTEFKRKKAETGSGYPSKRPWFPFSKGGLSCEALSGVDEKYPYQCKALFTYFYNGVYSTPGGYRFKETLSNPDTLPLFVSLDTAINETNIYADYIVPELCYPEGQYGWLTPHAPGNTFTGLRIPIIEPLVGATKDGRPFCIETLFIDLAKRMKLPGFGDNAIADKDGVLHPLNKAEDFYLRAYANIVANAKTPKATDEEVGALEKSSPVTKYKDVLPPDQWRQVCYALVRGGVFRSYESVFEKDVFTKGLGRYALYNETMAATVNTLTGERFSGLPQFVPPRFSNGGEVGRVDADYPFTVVTYKMSEHTQSRSLWFSIGMQIAPTNFVQMHEADADTLGVKDGDEVRLVSVSNPEGVQGRVQRTKLVRPGCVGVSFHFGHSQFGGSKLEVKDAKTAFLGGDAVATAEELRPNPAFRTGLNFNDVGRLDESLANTPLIDLLGGFPDFSSTRVRVVAGQIPIH
eukprot:TRINITY_DN2051_c0_g1_i1.p1 TRINITY_DN2051_c0_g1~~TRINITY_DN2051_c0_g1_i1.p1  ORF type:complete len:1642 (-),score=446.74 TRINITY_DN2051_c0_g1_i1:4346-9271(-)